ncbi:MAG: sodium/solute symporter [Pirellulales bacterium]|nr:sodium/solute symporter [Pirellulales bacterium]
MRVLRQVWWQAAFFVAWSETALNALADQPAVLSPQLRDQAVRQLRQALAEESRWVKVHAAEKLLALGYPQGVREAFEQELAIHGDESKYRIGIWRVLAQASNRGPPRRRWIHKIREAFYDANGPDRLHAVETLAKLKYKIGNEQEKAQVKKAATSTDDISVFAHWLLSQQSIGDDQLSAIENDLSKKLAASDSVTRLRASFVLRYLPDLAAESRRRLREAYRDEPFDSPARPYLLTTLVVLDETSPESSPWMEELIRMIDSGSMANRKTACGALAERGTLEQIPILTRLLASPDAAVRVAAAEAILRIGRRTRADFAPLDWIVVTAYFVGMLLVGSFFGRSTKSTDDYLLGGRQMKPWAVGLSLFATLLSTLTYLSMPGEMIKHGPMVVALIASFPLIGWVVGWLIIPRFMALPVTSAYEILEKRFDLSVRMLGSAMFLSLRLLWMGVVIHATVSLVLIPILGWNDSAVPIACAVLGAITVTYTAMGGLRAVVFTDVIQTFILLGGAILTMALITSELGGARNWWPTEWASSWAPFKIWFSPTSPRTLAGAALAGFVWYVCTAGSDQMAIQRYLATRDAAAARRMFFVSLGVAAASTVFLAVLGLALHAYFVAHPEMLADGMTINVDADMLFPRFIVTALPMGVSGLVVAGLLAAAMSSLSSGLNSSCSVVTVDFVDRFSRKATNSEVNHVRIARYVSWLIGVVVVVLSTLAGSVEGNLLEVSYKIVNLFVAPLFVLFFMAMFVPWATTLGAWSGALSGVGVAVGISFFGLLGMNIFWIMPGSLIAGATVGLLVSLASIRKHGEHQA